MLLNDDSRDLAAEVLSEAESILRMARQTSRNERVIENHVTEITGDEHCMNCGRPIGYSIAKNLCIYCYEEWD